MTVTYLSPAHEHRVSTSLKGLQDVDDFHLAGTQVFHHAHGWRVLKALRPSHVRGGICAVSADKGLYFRVKPIRPALWFIFLYLNPTFLC